MKQFNTDVLIKEINDMKESSVERSAYWKDHYDGRGVKEIFSGQMWAMHNGCVETCDEILKIINNLKEEQQNEN